MLAKQEPTLVNVALALGVPLLLGLACGFVNGYLVSCGRLPPLIVTLGTMYAFRGFIVWYHVNPIYQLQPWYRILGQEKIGPIPIPVIILLCVTGVSSLVLNRTRFGRYVYAVGGNEDAARAAGINVNLVKLCVYSISGFFCGLAGLVFTSRLGAAQSISGAGFEMVAIASVVVGGASLSEEGHGRKDHCGCLNHADRPERVGHAGGPLPYSAGNPWLHHYSRRLGRPVHSEKRGNKALRLDPRIVLTYKTK